MSASEQPVLPRNRKERRAAASIKRKEQKRARPAGAPAPSDKPVAAPCARSHAEPGAGPPRPASSAKHEEPPQVPMAVQVPAPPDWDREACEDPHRRDGDIEAFYLAHWSRTRGPLLKNTRAAVCRILALAEVTRLARTAGDASLRVRAARVWDEALAEVDDSNLPATGADHARASAALVDVRRFIREIWWDEDAAAELVEIFLRHSPGGSPMEQMRHYAWAELLAAALLAKDEALRLRAARTLLARTRDAARRVGRVKADDLSDMAREVILEFRDECAGNARHREAYADSTRARARAHATHDRPVAASPP